MTTPQKTTTKNPHCQTPIYSITLLGFRCTNHTPNKLFTPYVQRKPLGEQTCGYYLQEIILK